MTRLIIIIIAPNAPRSDELISVFFFRFLAPRVSWMKLKIELQCATVCWARACMVCAYQRINESFIRIAERVLFYLICKYWAFSHLLVSHTADEFHEISVTNWWIFFENIYWNCERVWRRSISDWIYRCEKLVTDAYHFASFGICFLIKFLPFRFRFTICFIICK